MPNIQVIYDPRYIQTLIRRGDRGWLMHFLVFLIYLVSGKTHFDNNHV